MPPREHFRRPLPSRQRWDALHGGWPMIMVADLNAKLPERYAAQPRVYVDSTYEIDVGTLEQVQAHLPPHVAADGGVAVATAVQAPTQPTLIVASDLPDQDESEVLIYDLEEDRLVAAVELVSPANKDRPEHRRAFAAKCGWMLLHRVCVAVVDLVTTRRANLYAEVLDFLGVIDPSLSEKPPAIYAASCRRVMKQHAGTVEAWAYPLELDRALPMLPLWLDEDTWVPLDLEFTYEQTCKNLRIP